jgi:hypothetical protein
MISSIFDTRVIGLAGAVRFNRLLGQCPLPLWQMSCSIDIQVRYQRNMFRISIADTPSRRTLLVEGTLIGPWIAELGTTWRNASRDLGGRKLVIDLTNVTVIGYEGENAIFDLMQKGVNFSCSGVLMRHMLKELARKKPEESPRR